MIARLRRKLAHVPGARLFLQPVQDIRVGGRQSNADYQYTLQADDPASCTPGRRSCVDALQHDSRAAPTSTPTSRRTAWRPTSSSTATPPRGSASAPSADRQHALRRVRPAPGLDDLQRAQPVPRGHGGGAAATGRARDAERTSTSAPRAGRRSGSADRPVRVAGHALRQRRRQHGAAARSASAAVGAQRGDQRDRQCRPGRRSAARAVSHGAGNDGAAVGLQRTTAAATRRSPSTTRARSSRPRSRSTCRRAGRSATRQAAIDAGDAPRSACRPRSTAASRARRRSFQQSLAQQPLLILAALVAVYIVLGMLYESYVHPLTILSTLPSAGVGAVLALLLFDTEFIDHRADRRHPADRHRQEERDHDDRLRARRRARRRA